MQKINPAWVAHNELFNEGGEGYNPHPKYIIATQPAASGAARMIRGKMRTHDDAIKFAKTCLSGAQKQGFLDEVKRIFPERY